jgi:Zn-dependent protease
VAFVVGLLLLAVPVIVAITFHEAAHGYVARHFGDETAWRQGRVTLNPLKHIDPFGTILLPALLYLARGPIFGFARPVPVNFGKLRNPRRDMVWVALAGPGMNLALATASAALLHVVPVFPEPVRSLLAAVLDNSIVVNLVLAVFNMIPLPPLDGGRVAVGLLPNLIAVPLARFERHGMLLLIGLVILVPFVADQLGYEISPLSWLIGPPVDFLYALLRRVMGVPE